MMMLEANQVCHLGNGCPYNEPYGNCMGVHTERPNTFQCDYVINGRLVITDGSRNPLDQTGKMKVIME